MKPENGSQSKLYCTAYQRFTLMYRGPPHLTCLASATSNLSLIFHVFHVWELPLMKPAFHVLKLQWNCKIAQQVGELCTWKPGLLAGWLTTQPQTRRLASWCLGWVWVWVCVRFRVGLVRVSVRVRLGWWSGVVYGKRTRAKVRVKVGFVVGVGVYVKIKGWVRVGNRVILYPQC